MHSRKEEALSGKKFMGRVFGLYSAAQPQPLSQSGLVAHDYNPSTFEAEAGRSQGSEGQQKVCVSYWLKG